MTRHRAILVILSTGLLVVGTATIGFASGKPTIGKRHLIASSFSASNHNALACPPGKSVAHTTCYLVGQGPGGTPPDGATAQTPDDYLNEVVPIRNGKPGTPVALPGAESASLIDCVSASACETVGYSTWYDNAAFIPLHNGSPGRPRAVAGYDGWQGLDCTSVGDCVAVGQFRKNNAATATRGLIVALRNGKPAKEQLIKGATFDGVSCLNKRTCVAVGQTNDFKHGVFTILTNGHAGKVHVVKSVAGLNEIACGWAKGRCVVPGFKANKFGSFPARVVIHGTKLSVTKLPTSAPVASYSCVSVGHCVEFGVVKPNSPGQRAVVAIVTKGHIGRITKISVAGDTGWVACVKVGSCDGYATSLTGQFPGDILRSFTVTY